MDQADELAELLIALKHEEGAVRFNAAVELAHLRQDAALPELVRSLGHESWVIRHYHAHHALQLLGSAAVPALLSALETRGREQACAAHTLYRLEPAEGEAVVSALVLALKSSDSDVCDDAIHVLKEVGTSARAAAPALRELLKNLDETMSRRSGAACALKAMEALEPEMLPVLVKILRSEEWSARFQISGVLMDMGEAAHAVVPDLRALLADITAPVGARVDAAQLLAKIHSETTQNVEALVNALNDTDWWIRLYAARALGALSSSAATAVPALMAALQDEEPNVCRNAAYALAEIGKEEAAPALIRALESDEVAAVAAEALVKIGGSATLAAKEPLDTGTAKVQRMAAYALTKMDTQEGSAAVDTWHQASMDMPFIPSYADLLLPSPKIRLDGARIKVFETLLEETLARGEGSVLDYRCAYPKYEFLAYMVQEKGCVLHGSNRQDIGVMNPIRRSLEAKDGNPLGNINGVYATPDPIWPLFYAVVDRIHHDIWLINGPLHEPDAAGTEKAFYHFSINIESLRERPYTDGMVYILPGTTFENAGGAERASRSPVRPLVKLAVSPADFPFLDRMRGFDCRHAGWLSLEERFVFLDEVRKYPVRALPVSGGGVLS